MDNVNIYNNDIVKCQFHIIYLVIYILLVLYIGRKQSEKVT